MSKQISAKELAEIFTKILATSEIDNADSFAEFMTEAAELATKYCGGVVLNHASPPTISAEEIGEWMIGIHADDSLPEDGGIWKDYDTNVAFVNGEEIPKTNDSASLTPMAEPTNLELCNALQAFIHDMDGRFGEIPDDCEAYRNAVRLLRSNPMKYEDIECEVGRANSVQELCQINNMADQLHLEGKLQMTDQNWIDFTELLAKTKEKFSTSSSLEAQS